MKQYKTFKDLHGNTIAQLKEVNSRLEELESAKKIKEILENEIHQKDKAIKGTNMKLVKMKEFYYKTLTKIKVHKEEINKKDEIINDI